jgi:hypothetical protein
VRFDILPLELPMPITLADLRRFAVARSLFPPTTLNRALDRMGFVRRIRSARRRGRRT